MQALKLCSRKTLIIDNPRKKMVNPIAHQSSCHMEVVYGYYMGRLHVEWGEPGVGRV